MYARGVSGKAQKFTKAVGVGGRFYDLKTAIMWADIGRDVAGGSWLIRRDGDSYIVLSPAEQKRERQLVVTG